MKVSEIQAKDVAEYLRFDDPENDEWITRLKPIMDAAKAFIANYTHLSEKELDKYEDIWIAYMVLCQDMNDNRSYYVDKNNVNKVVMAVLDMHQRNLIV